MRLKLNFIFPNRKLKCYVILKPFHKATANKFLEYGPIYKSNEGVQVDVDGDSALVHFLEHGVLLKRVARSLRELREVISHLSHFPVITA